MRGLIGISSARLSKRGKKRKSKQQSSSSEDDIKAVEDKQSKCYQRQYRFFSPGFNLGASLPSGPAICSVVTGMQVSNAVEQCRKRVMMRVCEGEERTARNSK